MTAKTPEHIRRAIQQSSGSVRTLARQFGLSPTTVQRWRKSSTRNERPASKTGRPFRLNSSEEQIVVMFRRQTLLPLDDCVYAFQLGIPGLTRTTLHRCFERNGISSLAKLGVRRRSKSVRDLRMGVFHLGSVPLTLQAETVFMFIAFDRVSKFMVCHVAERISSPEAVVFLDKLLQRVPYPIHTIETGDTGPFAIATDSLNQIVRNHCRLLGISYRFQQTRVPHQDSPAGSPADDRRGDDGYQSLEEMGKAVDDLVKKYNFSRRLKALGGRTPAEFIQQETARTTARPK